MLGQSIGTLRERMSAETRSPEIYNLIRSGTRADYTKGQIIQSTEGQKTMNFVSKGFIKRYLISNTGSLGVEVIYGPADFFPVTLMLERFFGLGIYEGPEVYFYEAMTDTTVITINVDILEKEVKSNPLLYRDLLLETGRRLHTTLNSLENMAIKAPANRVAHQLIYFASIFGERTKTGTRIAIPLTAQDIADVLGIEVNSVKDSLEQLREKDLVKINKHIIITDIGRLREEAHS
jgi:CRP-like cAMP-binding protein